jgi:diaminopropionate ammonia-lyase
LTGLDGGEIGMVEEFGGLAVRAIANPRARADAPYRPEQAAVIDARAVAAAKAEISSWPGYAPTPLLALPALAAASGVARLWCKDEGQRFGLGSFKALGGSFAVFRHLTEVVRERTGTPVTSADLIAGRHRDAIRSVTVTTATDGNHGRSVAWGAELFGCRCVVYMHEGVSEGRAEAVRAFGAEVVRVPGTYDDSVRACAEDARRFGRQVISDTAYPGYAEIPRTVMHGYAVMVEELLAQLPAGDLPTHVIVQVGCGGFAAAVYGRLWERLGERRPRLVVVEPINADCVFRSGDAGRLVAARGGLETVMGGLACGEVSLVAWPILETGAAAFMAIGDSWAVRAMRRLASGDGGDPRIVAGEAGAAGIAALMAASASESARRIVGLGSDSRVLAIVSEGATDAEVYRSIVGRAPGAVAA